jgi:hypothetical protein
MTTGRPVAPFIEAVQRPETLRSKPTEELDGGR